MEIYEFKFCCDIYESNYVTISTHRTKRGAYKAMKEFITNEYNKWYNNRIMCGKYKGDKQFEDCRWYIKRTILYD